ncbi:hypothetical protein ACVWZA_000916 [Sphingomonas sp. UYAg733]
MLSHRPVSLFALPFLVLAAPATAAPWWYAARGADRVVFIDTGSIQRDKDIVTYSSKTVIRKQGDPAAMTVNFMRADCTKRRLGWSGIQRFGYDEAVIDTSTRPDAEMEDAVDAASHAELDFACADAKAREAGGAFPLGVDDAAFAEALLAESDKGLSPRALQDRLLADPAVVVIRSTAPATSTFGKIQTVKLGQPMVPPRDYAKGPQIPDPKDYPSNEVGRIYDIAYQGIKDGRVQFEVRGYSIDDLVHPGSGQSQSAYPGEKKVNILSLAITIKQALPDRITYSVAIKPMASAEPFCPPGGCEDPVATPSAAEATETTP